MLPPKLTQSKVLILFLIFSVENISKNFLIIYSKSLEFEKDYQKLLNDRTEYEKMSKAHNPYGDGKACKEIVDYLKRNLK